MTDRELLEKAAKAADLDTLFQMYGWDEIGDGAFLDANEPPTVWNPLTDDGDALRLAVRLNLTSVFHPALNQALVRQYHDKTCEWIEDGEKHPDPCAATRRAIVRAAAALADGGEYNPP